MKPYHAGKNRLNCMSGHKRILFAVGLVGYWRAALACLPPEEVFCVDFYKSRNLIGPVAATATNPEINHDWGVESPANGVPKDNFSARWRGKFKFDDGQYSFKVAGDDGFRLRLDGQIIIDQWKNPGSKEQEVKLTLGPGIHLIEAEYYETTKNAFFHLDWVPVVNTHPGEESSAVSKRSPREADPDSAVLTEVVGQSSGKFPIGINLSGFSYWSSAVPFKDLIIQSGAISVLKATSNDLCDVQPPKDSEGYPLYLPRGCRFRIWSVFHIKSEYWPEGVPPYRPGHYVLLHKGAGNIKLGWDASNVRYVGDGRIDFDVLNPGSGIQIEVLETNKDNHVRDMHIVHAADEATFKSQPFNERWLNILRPFNVIRFMDWGGVSGNITAFTGSAVAYTATTITLPTNAPDTDGFFNNMVVIVNVNGKWPRVFVDRYDGASRTLHLRSPIEASDGNLQTAVTIFDFPNKTWEARAQPVTLGQTGSSGVAFEYMIALANSLNADPWISIPTAADDRFVEELARFIKARLKPTLKCYVEYSNETWNFGYPGYHYSEAQVNDKKLTGTWIPADAWQAYRAVEIFRIFNRVFGEPNLREQRENSRLVRVLASQTAWLDRAEKVMDWTGVDKTWPTQGLPAHKFADAWAITTYFSAPDGAKSVEQASVGELIDMQNADIDEDFAVSPKPGIYRQIAEASRTRGLKVVTYEGGTHLLAPQDRVDLVSKMVMTNRDPRMEEVYSHVLAKWEDLANEYGSGVIGVWSQYFDVGRYSKFGYWGLVESTYQNTSLVPKYKAFKAISAH